MNRTPRPIIPNATYFITAVTDRRQKWFAKPGFAQIAVDQWKHYETAYEFHLETYSILPDHYHVVLNVGEKETISQNPYSDLAEWLEREGRDFVLDLFSRYRRWTE